MTTIWVIQGSAWQELILTAPRRRLHRRAPGRLDQQQLRQRHLRGVAQRAGRRTLFLPGTLPLSRWRNRLRSRQGFFFGRSRFRAHLSSRFSCRLVRPCFRFGGSRGLVHAVFSSVISSNEWSEQLSRPGRCRSSGWRRAGRPRCPRSQ